MNDLSNSAMIRAALDALVAKWKAEANQDAHYPHVPEVMRFMADELAAALATREETPAERQKNEIPKKI